MSQSQHSHHDTAHDKRAILARIDEMLEGALRLRLQGAEQPRFHRAQAYADGYMTAVLEQGVVSAHELLALVAQARRRIEGPATRAFELQEA